MRAFSHLILAAAAVLAAPGIGLAQATEDEAEPPSAEPVPREVISNCVQDAEIILRIEACTRVIENGQTAEGNLAWAFTNRGLAYEAVQRFDRALSDYNTALLLDPTYAVGYNNRGNVHARMGNLDAAIADHTRAVEIDPDYAHAWYNRGADYEEAGELEAALEDYDEAIAADPEYITAIVSRATVNCALGNVEAAVEDRLRLVEIGHIGAAELQEYLADQGYYTAAIDGLFGPGSRRALTAWTEAGCP